MHISYIAIAISIIYKLTYAVIKNADKIEKKVVTLIKRHSKLVQRLNNMLDPQLPQVLRC